MKKGYCLQLNGSNNFFQYWEGVTGFFAKAGLEEKLMDDQGEEYFLHEIVGEGELRIINECLCERGDDYITIDLQEIIYQD